MMAELPHLAQALHVFMAASPKTALHSRVRATREPACPIDPRVDEILVEIEDVLDRCEGRRIADLIRQPAMRFIIWVKDTRREKWLDGVSRALDVRRVHLKANKILGFDRVRIKRTAPCPDCSLPLLFSWAGSDTIECGDEACNFAASREEYDMYVRELITEEKR